MPLALGSTAISKAYLGSSPVLRAYLGSVSVFALLPNITGNAQGTVTVQVGDGTYSITIADSSLAHFNGTHALNTADFSGGPVYSLVPPISGGTEEGSILTALPALWFGSDADGPVTILEEWYRGETATGITAATYQIPAGAAGEVFTRRSRGSNSAGFRIAISSGITATASSAAVWNITGNILVSIKDANPLGRPTVSGNVVGNL